MMTQAAPSRLSFEDFKTGVLADYRLAVASREASLIGRREVLTGKAKFGIFGDGKELAQIAAAKAMQPGDLRSGYYRDQTLMFATGMSDIEKFFSQLYANPDVEQEPSTAGRMMNGHYGTRWLDEDGNWKNLMAAPQSSSDISPTGGQMLRALGLAFASKCYRQIRSLQTGFEKFSNRGNEVVFCTIGDASTSEGHFWETMNAAAVLKVPLAVFVWDDGYGISVPRNLQTTKNSISEALKGMTYEENVGGIRIHKAKGWDYAELVNTIQQGIEEVRETHIPALFHIQEVTQPQGHSTSGSHERYKSAERLEWEKEMDCLVKMRQFILENELATEDELTATETEAKDEAREAKRRAWDAFQKPIFEQREKALALIDAALSGNAAAGSFSGMLNTLRSAKEPIRKDVLQTISRVLRAVSGVQSPAVSALQQYAQELREKAADQFNSNLHSTSAQNALNVPVVAAQYGSDAQQLNGYEVLNKYFDELFTQNPAVIAFGEDLGKIGDVNQGFAGLQEKHGAARIFDTGIREATIIGQGIGAAMRGLRPIAEIQYLDYLLYGLQPLSDDVATLQYRTKGGQKCPLIVRTRGHRLEGIWHSGSPMGMILNALRGMYVCVPRNMVQAAGMYNTLLKSDEPGLVVECLNGYRLKEKMPQNLMDFTVPLGVPEILQEGEDLTIVSYGSTLRVIAEAIEQYLEPAGISVELIDVQTLLPFDTSGVIVKSLQKTGRILIIDEDVPGGASAYIFQQVMEIQGGYRFLDAQPRTLSAKAHRPAYATDGDYFSKPNAEEIAELAEQIMAE
jgi:pyruvate/2-oxoglutarate/acetoin dehydrogenase E1 component/TPP-dependent pyruvate/acetoin dehydrogenase alpha subunit